MPSEIEEQLSQEFAFVEGLIETGLTFIQAYAWQLIAASIIFIVGYILSARLQKWVIKIGSTKNIDRTLLTFLAGLVRTLILAFTLMITLSKLGITITPLIAAIGAGIFGATFAIQAPIANYAAGLGIILLRPFKLEDVITVENQTGRVEEITLPMTYIRNEDGEQIQIPNKFIMGEIIKNSGSYQLVVGEIGISYKSDPEIAINSIAKLLSNFEEIEKNPVPRVGISQFGEYSIQISYRYRVPSEQLHRLEYQVNAEVFKSLKEAQIKIPFPQQEVTLLSSESQPS